MSKISYMLEGSLTKQLIRFSVPLIMTNVLQVLFNMSDIAVVGRFAGPEALGSVGSTAMFCYLFTGFFLGLGGGVNARTALHLGAGQERHVRETVHTAFFVCLLFGLIFMTWGLIFCRSILELLNTKPELIDGSELYMKIYVLGVPGLAVYSFGSSVCSAAGNTKRPLIILTSAGVLNVVLNLIFVIVFHMGVAGVAAASAISQTVSALSIVIYLSRSKEIYGLKREYLRITPEKAVKIMVLGVPSGAQHMIFAIANLSVQAGINSFSAVMVEGNSAAANSDGLVYDVMAAFYTGCTSFIAQNLGAGKRERVLKSYLISLGLSAGAGTVCGIGLALWGEGFLSIFTTDPHVIEAGMIRLRIMGFSYWLSAGMDCTTAASRGLGKSNIPTLIVIVGCCALRITWVNTVFACYKTIESLYLVYPISWIVTSIAEILYFRSIYQKTFPPEQGRE